VIYFDVTKAGRSGHRSGLNRVSERLRAELGDAAQTGIVGHVGPVGRKAGDWFLTAEIFGAEERPGVGDFLRAKPCRLAAIFHDAIPLRHPQITWPRSVARHPGYMKNLARFDRVWAVSAASREDLLGYWRWLGVEAPPVDVLAHGADFDGTPRVTASAASALRPSPPVSDSLIPYPSFPPLHRDRRAAQEPGLSPRRLRGALARGTRLRAAPRGPGESAFRRADRGKIKRWRREFPGLHYHAAAGDAAVAALYAQTRATVFPTIAEGCGLPLLESLWKGVPCVCSDLPVLTRKRRWRRLRIGAGQRPRRLERTRCAGCSRTTRWHARLVREATTRPLPTWSEAAQTLRAALVG
jgi:hypothetical protein